AYIPGHGTRGPRVVGPGGENEVVVIATESLRYGTARNGYHGGATPQEMLAPVVILTPRGRDLAGLEPVEIEPPTWWKIDEESAAPETMAQPEREMSERDLDATERTVAYEVVETVPDDTRRKLPVSKDALPSAVGASSSRRASAMEPPWIKAFFESEVWEAQKALSSKRRLDEEEIRTLLVTLERAGGSLTTLAFAKAIEKSRMRVDGFL